MLEFIGLALTAILVPFAALGDEKKGLEQLQAGDAFFKKGDFKGAQETYLAALQADPDLEPAYLGCAEARRRLEEPDAALEILNQGLEKLPRSARLLLAAAAIFEELQRFESAAAFYERILAGPSASPGARAALGLLRLRQGNLAAAIGR